MGVRYEENISIKLSEVSILKTGKSQDELTKLNVLVIGDHIPHEGGIELLPMKTIVSTTKNNRSNSAVISRN